MREILTDIVAHDQRAAELNRRLRLLLKRGEVQHQPLDVNEAIRDVLRLLRIELVNHNVVLNSDLAPALPRVMGDRVQLQQVVLNLIVNGCDAMADAPASDRRLTVQTALADDGGVRVTIADRGVGIPPDKLETVFQFFFTTKPHGLGLGLSVCRTILTSHGGRIWAEPNADRGAMLCFTLPA